MTEKKPLPKTEEKAELLIAFASGKTVIPFENVIACEESPGSASTMHVLIKGVSSIALFGSDVEKFLKEYEVYLHLVQVMTLRNVGDIDE